MAQAVGKAKFIIIIERYDENAGSGTWTGAGRFGKVCTFGDGKTVFFFNELKEKEKYTCVDWVTSHPAGAEFVYSR